MVITYGGAGELEGLRGGTLITAQAACLLNGHVIVDLVALAIASLRPAASSPSETRLSSLKALLVTSSSQ